MSGVTNTKGVEHATSADGTRDGADSVNAIKQRLRGDGLQTVSKLLQETRAENKILKDRNNQLERTVDSLNNRLIKNNSVERGGGENFISQNSTTQSHNSQPDDELNPPVTSRQLVENLVKENTKLKQHIQNPRKIDELAQKNFGLQSVNRQLAIDKARLEEELNRVKDLLHLSDKDKDRHILKLGHELNTYKEQWQREKSLRETLEQQIGQLNNELADTAQSCLMMRRQLPTSSNSPSDRLNTPPNPLATSQHLPQATSKVPGGELYGESRTSESRRQESRSDSRDHPDSQASGRNTIEQLSDDNQLLRRQLREKDKELKSLREKCDILEHQLRVYKDDFQNERQDREKMHQRFAELENEHQKMKDQMPKKIGNAGNNAWDSQSMKHKAGQVARVPSKPSKDVKQVPKSTAKSAEDNISLSSQTDLVRPNIQDLACYKCGKKFKREQHSDLIDHLDECAA